MSRARIEEFPHFVELLKTYEDGFVTGELEALRHFKDCWSGEMARPCTR
ncbi:hypothetical protein [Candidatus Palauibacter sp.]